MVTRAAHQASSLGDALAARGLTVVAIPAIALETPSDEYASLHAALERLDEFDWLLFTSANAVEVFARECEEVGADEVPCRIGSIGAATSRALKGAGLQVSLQPASAVSEAFAEELRPYVRHQQVLLVQAESARDILPRSLSAAGAQVHVVAAYRTVVPAKSAEAIRRELPGLDAITFTSSSSVRNLLELCDAAGVTLPSSITLASIGPITSQTIRECGYVPHLEAIAADVEVLASQLARFLLRS